MMYDVCVRAADYIIGLGKYELDSLMAMLKLSYAYFNYSQDLGCFDSTWLNAVNLIIATVQAQQNGTEEEGDNNPYMFERVTPVATDTLMLSGRGAPANHTGEILTHF